MWQSRGRLVVRLLRAWCLCESSDVTLRFHDVYGSVMRAMTNTAITQHNQPSQSCSSFMIHTPGWSNAQCRSGTTQTLPTPFVVYGLLLNSGEFYARNFYGRASEQKIQSFDKLHKIKFIPIIIKNIWTKLSGWGFYF